MRARVVIGVAMALALGLLALELSGSAGRIAGSDHVNYDGFYSTVAAGQEICQGAVDLPREAVSAHLEIGTYGAPLPALTLSFRDSQGQVLSSGQVPGGGVQGVVSFALGHPHGQTVAGTLCLLNSGTGTLALAGEPWAVDTPGSSEVQGKSQGGRFAVFYVSASESWWQLLGTLSQRFGFGKARFFGSWTLPFAAVLMLLVWIGVGRLLWRELS